VAAAGTGSTESIEEHYDTIAESASAFISVHPMHLHRHSFELTSLSGKPTSGILKDVVMLGGYQDGEIDFIADNPGLTLFHCHQQLHMDFGFMTLFDNVWDGYHH
jgi:hypothetical protein